VKTENGTVPRFDLAPWYWPVIWWVEGVIAAELAVHWWSAHRAASLALAAVAVTWGIIGAFLHWLVNRSDRMRVRREFLTMARTMPSSDCLNRDEHLVFSRIVNSLLGLKAVHVVQVYEDDVRAGTGTRHVPVHQFSAFPLEPRVRHEVPAVTVRESADGEIEAVIAKPGAGALRRARLRWQMTRKGFAAVTADDIASLAALLRDADPIVPHEEPPA
jgi:hypothetical protein